MPDIAILHCKDVRKPETVSKWRAAQSTKNVTGASWFINDNQGVLVQVCAGEVVWVWC